MEKAKREVRKERKVYEKPQIVYRQSLEALAGVCGDARGKESALTPCIIPYAS